VAQKCNVLFKKTKLILKLPKRFHL